MRKKLVFLLILVFFSFSVSAESFGADGGTLPNITEVSIYDVDGLSQQEQRNDGELLDSGLNKTFEINQTEETEYRFQFEVKNDGGSTMDISGEDELFHDGLNSTWSVNQIWYNISGNNGGSFTDRRVSWDTDYGDSLAPGEVISANYLVNISENQTETYSQRFEINDTSEASGSFDEHNLEITKYGEMSVNLSEPPNDTTLQKDTAFLMNGSVQCLNGECGKVEVEARYNQSDTADTSIPVNSGTPFHTNSSNPKTCSENLGKEEICRVTWFVNASGSHKSFHKLDVSADSNISSIDSNDSEDSLVQINSPIIMDLQWDNADFGTLDPGSKNRSADGNENRVYNVSMSEESDYETNVWIRSSDLSSVLEPDQYIIPANNMSYSLQNDITTEKYFSNEFQLLKQSVNPGTIFTTYYWIDVPNGIISGDYEGSMYFKANQTG